jgi:hypothetical protein
MAKVTAKKKCCQDQPRCQTCPVVLKRLSDAGHLERLDLRKYKVMGKPKKAELAAARTR